MSKLSAILTGARGRHASGDGITLADKAERLLDACHPFQRAFAADEAKRLAVLTGGRCGKTTGGRVRLLRRMLLTERASCLLVADTKEHARGLVWAQLKDMVERLAIDARPQETRLEIKLLDNGSTLKLVGADDQREIDKLRGIPRHEVGIEEGASHRPRLLEHLIERVLEPRLGDYDGTLWVVGTPGHILAGPFYDITRTNSDTLGWSVHRWSMADAAPYVSEIATAWAVALRNKETKGWSDDNPVWKREYLGLWAADDTENVFRYRPHTEDGKPWNRWKAEKDPATGFAALPEGEWVYVYGLDMGHSDPFALVALAINPATNQIRQVYEFEKKGMYVRDIARLLVGEDWVKRIDRGEDVGEPGGLVGTTGWPVGMVADASHLGGAIIQELREVYGIPLERAEQKHKHDSIELTNGDLVDGRMMIMEGSKLEEQILGLQWAIDDIGRLKEHKGQANHLTDAMIYARRAAMHLVAGVSAPSETPEELPVKLAPPTPPGSDRGYDMAPSEFYDYGEEEY